MEEHYEQLRQDLLDYVGTAWATCRYPILMEYLSRLSDPNLTVDELLSIDSELNFQSLRTLT